MSQGGDDEGKVTWRIVAEIAGKNSVDFGIIDGQWVKVGQK